MPTNIRREKFKYLFREAIVAQIFYTIFMLIAKLIFHRPWDYFDYVAGIVLGLIFGSMKWKEKEKKIRDEYSTVKKVKEESVVKRTQCPCCGYFTIESEDEVIVDICDICFWQYDIVAHERPHISIGANKVSLHQAIENYKRNGVCKLEFIHHVRAPFSEELPENNPA